MKEGRRIKLCHDMKFRDIVVCTFYTLHPHSDDDDLHLTKGYLGPSQFLYVFIIILPRDVLRLYFVLNCNPNNREIVGIEQHVSYGEGDLVKVDIMLLRKKRRINFLFYCIIKIINRIRDI